MTKVFGNSGDGYTTLWMQLMPLNYPLKIVKMGTYIQNAILLSHKKEQNNAICSNMDGPRDYHTEWSQTQRHISYAITYMWNLKKRGVNELIYKTEIESQM